MGNTLVLYVVALLAIPDQDLKYIQIVNQLRSKQEASEWDRQMEDTLNAKFKELFYTAYSGPEPDGHHRNNEKQVVMEYVHKNRPKLSRQLRQEIKGLQAMGVRRPAMADWRQIMAQKEKEKKIPRDVVDIKKNLIEETIDAMI